jgi:hypothetical protein
MAEVGAELSAPISALPGACVGEDCLGLPWDPLREQDWESLSSDATLPWEMSSLDGPVMDMDSCPRSDYEHVRLQNKACIQFSPVAIDTMADCFWDNTGLTMPSSVKKQSIAGPFDDVIRTQQFPKYHQAMSHTEEAAHSMHDNIQNQEDDAASEEKYDHHPGHVDNDHKEPSHADQHRMHEDYERESKPRVSGTRIRVPPRLKIPAQESQAPANRWTSPRGDKSPGETAIFVVHLFVTAIADGKIMPDTSEKLLGVLEQVRVACMP